MERVIQLLDAIPYLRAYSGQTFVVKVGGELMLDPSWLDGVARDLAVLHRLGIVTVLVHGGGPKRRNLDHLAAEANVCEPEAPSDQAAVAEERTHLFRRRVGGDVEILGVQPQQNIPYAATDEKRLVPRFMQSVQHLQRALGDFVP